MSVITRAAPRNRWITGFVLLLLLATALLGLGVVIEQSPSYTEAGTVASADSPSGADADETNLESDDGEVILGAVANTESTPTVGAAVLLALTLAAAVWWRPNRVTVTLAAVYCLAAGTLDARETAHQLVESEAGIATLAAGVMLLHLAAAVVAVEAFDACGRAAPPQSRPAALG